MSTTAYESALYRHFRRSLLHGWCRNSGCTTCGAHDYRESLRRELGHAAVETGVEGALRGRRFEWPPEVVERAVLALAALAERGDFIELGVDECDFALMRELMPHRQVFDGEYSVVSQAFRRAEAHARARRPDTIEATTAWNAMPLERRLRDLLDGIHPGVTPPWPSHAELGALLDLGPEDLGPLQALIDAPRTRPGSPTPKALREVVRYARSLKDPSHRLHPVWCIPEHVAPELAAAYRATLFVVRDNGRETVLRIGVRSEEAAELHRRFEVPESCIVTAWNPRSRELPAAENAARHRRLEGRVAWLELATLPAEGRDPAGAWTPEQSLWIAGAGLQEALFLGNAFGQHAIVCIGPDAVPRLAWPAQARSLVHRA